MNANTKVKATNKWSNEATRSGKSLAVIYSLKNMEDDSLPELLVFYQGNSDPGFTRDQVLTIEDAQSARPYKATIFNSWDDIPNDMSKAFLF